MRNLTIVGTLLCVVACSKPNESASASTSTPDAATTGPSTGAIGTAAGTTTAASPSVLEKALSFVSGTAPFEGEITMTVASGGRPPDTIVYRVKGTKMRFDVPAGHHRGPAGGAGYAIFDSTTKKVTTISDDKKMAFVIDMDKMPGPATAAAADPTKKPDVQKTGKEDMVAGYRCEIWTITEKNGDTGEACMAKGITFPTMGHENQWAKFIGDSFPLRMSMKDASGKEKTKLEVTKIDKSTIDDKTLEVPAGYKTMSMSDMMSGMGGGGMPGMRHP